MPTQTNKLLVRRFYEEVVNTGDVGHIEDFIAPDCVEVHDNVTYESGIEGMKAHILGGRRTYTGYSSGWNGRWLRATGSSRR